MKIGDKVRVKANGREGRITSIQDAPKIYFLGGWAFYDSELELIPDEIKNDADLFKALLEGKKVQHNLMSKCDYISMKDGNLYLACDLPINSLMLTSMRKWEIYGSPKTKWIAVVGHRSYGLFDTEESAQYHHPRAIKYIEVTLD